MLNKDFKEFAGLLNSIGVEYLVVGGYALAAHGHPRYTGDLDLWVRPVASNVEKLLDTLKRFGFGEIGLEEFRANKRAAGRAKDLADLEALDDPQGGS
jgi:hypothetical protein